MDVFREHCIFVIYSLPSHQDCHEMWSKKKKKKEGKATEGPPTGKPNLHNPPRGGVASVSPSNHQSSSSSSSYRNESTDTQCNNSSSSHRPDGVHPAVSRQHQSLAPPHSLSVPLPPAPLSATNILESLNSTLAADGGSGSGPGSTDERLHFKQVIAKAQRSLIEEITQTLEKGRGGKGELPMVASITGRATQSFDYDNQSNKGLEEKAAAQLYDKDKDCI